MNKSDGVFTIFTDGCSRGNPGESGVGFVIYDPEGECLREFSQNIGVTTNNIAEYTALIYALQEALMLNLKKVIIYTDSELMVKQIRGEYKVRDGDLRRLYQQFLHLRMGFERVKVELINRGENKEADKLAAQAVKKPS